MFVAEDMYDLGSRSSKIREIYEYGLKRKAEIGEDNVFDFSIGNPSVPAPNQVTATLTDLIQNIPPAKLHAYTSSPGNLAVRKRIAEYIEKTFAVTCTPNHLYITCGAAASLAITLHALLRPGDEVLTFAPYFPEYKVFVETTGALFQTVPCSPSGLQPDPAALEKAINAETKVLIINSPNNPTGAVYREDLLKQVAGVLSRKSKEYGRPIFILSDEPYRELVYDVEVPYIPRLYQNTIINYSFSKSLSLAGERIGYIFVPPEADFAGQIMPAVSGAARSLGYVCAPSIFQYVIEKCIGSHSDLKVYRRNRDFLYKELTGMGFEAVYPDGAFYLFLKAPIADAVAFCEKARDFELLLVPSDSFGVTGYVRISYCVAFKTIEKSLAAFQKLAKFYKIKE